MHTPTKSELPRYLQAWRSNTQPRLPEEFNAVVDILSEENSLLRTKARIRWNVLKDRYEMDPVIVEPGTGTYELVELVLEPTNFDNLTQVLLPQLGIQPDAHHRLFAQGRPRVSRPSSLPPSCFPKLVER